MKKSLLILCGVISAAAVMADNTSLGNPIVLPHPWDAYYINGEFTKDGEPKLTFTNWDEDNKAVEITVYNQDLESVASFTIPDKLSGYSEKSMRVLEYNPDGEKWESTYSKNTEEEAVAYIKERIAGPVSETTSNGVTYYYPAPGAGGDVHQGNYFQYWIFGTAYPCVYYYITVRDSDDWGYPFVIHQVNFSDGCYTKTDQWTTPVRSEYYSSGYRGMSTYNYNTGVDDFSMAVTQTLFNDDDDFEYITEDFTIELIETWDDDDDSYKKTDIYSKVIHGFTVCGTNGNEVMKVSLPSGLDSKVKSLSPRLVFIGDKTYLSFDLETYNDEYINLYYEIERGSNSLRQVGEPIKVSVRPTVISPDESVNVKLSETNGESRITVTDMKGRTLLNSKVNAEGAYQIPGRSMGKGMNIITVDTPEGRQSTKVVVR